MIPKTVMQKMSIKIDKNFIFRGETIENAALYVKAILATFSVSTFIVRRELCLVGWRRGKEGRSDQ